MFFQASVAERVDKMPRLTKQKFKLSQVPFKTAPDDPGFFRCYLVSVSVALSWSVDLPVWFPMPLRAARLQHSNPSRSAASDLANRINFHLGLSNLTRRCLVPEGEDEEKFGSSIFKKKKKNIM